ncbi:hypothetical protein ACN2WE_24005 [Streptomyces sp. cg28]|uniref:hypothetical protein n=1 Tax=Streptomyces sp. cg28 TaxID=3403457 RepID=UPI003B225014
MKPIRTDLAAGTPDALAAMVTNYACGSCTGEVDFLATNGSTVHAVIAHDDGCPVLNGHVSSLGDIARAATIPDTFRA